MLPAFAKAFQQLPDPRFRRIMAVGVVWALALNVAVHAGIWQLFQNLKLFAWSWLNALIEVTGWAAVFLAGLWVFPALVGIVVSFYLDEVASIVERKHYPDLEEPKAQPIWESVALALRFSLVTLGFNILAIPFYFIPILNLAVFFLVNGYLLGREYFELVAARRFQAQDIRRLRVLGRGRLMAAGMVIALAMAVPLFNLAAPLLATAWMVHLLQTLREPAKPL
jgi:CysZ protein